MCGICGFWTHRTEVIGQGREVLRDMSDAIAHRGPDASGTWVDESNGVGLGHRRLSILDLSVRGRQPMESADRRWVASFNGEIYNFEQIRAELEGVNFRGDSDTEVAVEAFARWGIDDAVKRFVGMFAFAVWDRKRSELHLIRDRLGIKPLYFGRNAGALLFASELTPFKRFPGFAADVDRHALSAYLRYNCVPGAQCILQGFQKLLPGRIATFREAEAEPQIRAYWDAAQVLADKSRRPIDASTEETTQMLHEALRRAVSDRLVADVPLGAFLSGGVDSSTVVALMQAQSDRPVKTFSIGFDEELYDEAKYAREVADVLGTDHTELYVSPGDALEVIGRLGRMYDEPFADSSQIPTFLVSELARRDVTVALSGDGGDELFCGYNRHIWAPRVWNAMDYLPQGVRKMLSSAMMSVSVDRWEQVFDRLGPALPDIAQVAMELNLLTEDNLPYYSMEIHEMFGAGGAWGEWARRWTAEEGRHSIVMRDWMTVTRAIDPIELEVGYALIPLVDESQGGDLLERISLLRKQAALELGILVPPIRIRDDIRLPANEYIIKLRGAEIARAEVMSRFLLALDTGGVIREVEGVETMEHARVLKSLGCHALQGYAFARAMDAANFRNFVASPKFRQAS
mgnify:CR=1 FL=1